MNILESRRRTLGKGVYKKTVEGNPAIAQGSLARRYPGITMQGWTEQDSTTGAQLFDKNSTVTGLLNANGSIIQLDGYSTGDYIEVIEGQSYYCTKTGSTRGKYYNSNKEPIQITNYEDFSFYNGTYITIPQGVSYIRFSLADSNIDTIMLNVGTTSLPYEPYTGGAPSPSPEYPQEIVSAGNWNEETQKWEYEIEVGGNDGSSQTVILTSDRPLTKWDRLEKRNGQWGWVYKSNVLTYDGNEDWVYDANSTRGEYSALYYWDTGLLNKNYSYCSKFGHIVQPYDSEGIMDNNGDSRSFYVSIRTDRLDTPDANGFKQWLQLNPLTVWYETVEETFVPLSASEQEQMNELYTFRPTTVLSNDAGCEMALTYKTKKSLEVTA